MALSLLKRVAGKALNTLGGAATSAFQYLRKNAPEMVDKGLEFNPGTRIFSKRGQQDVENTGKLLQQMPDTTVRLPKFIQDNPLTGLLGPLGNKNIREIATSIPGEVVKSYGRTLERVGTDQGRNKIIEGVKQVPGQTKNLFTGGMKKVPENAMALLENPAVEDALNATDLFALGAGTLARVGAKKAVKGIAEQGIKKGVQQAVKTGGKEFVEAGGKRATKTILKEASDVGASKVFKKTSELFDTVVDPENNKIAMDNILKKNGVNPEQIASETEQTGKKLTKAQKKTQAIFEKPQAELTDTELALKNTQDYQKKTSMLFDGAEKTLDSTPEMIANPPKPTQELFKKGTDYAKDWINTREGFTAWRAGDIKKTPALTQFDKEGMNAILDLQSGKNPERYKAIKDFTDGLYELETKAGVLSPDQYRKNYLPQLWENSPEQIDDVFKKVVGNTPGFSRKRLLEDYKTGIDAGLTPRYNRISDLLESRYKTAQRALADREMIDNLVKSGGAKTLDTAPVGWERIEMTTPDGKALAVAPETAKIIKNYTEAGSPLLAKTAEFVSNAKQTILSAGIPKTGWNFHTGVNIPARAAAARKNPFGAIVDSVIWNTNPNSASHYIEKVVPKDITDGLLKAGMSISRSADDAGYGFKPREGKSVIAKIRTGFDKLFSEAAFDKILPAHKLKVGWETYQTALKNGATQDEAFKVAATTANEIFGGVNVQEMGRSKDFQNVLRTFLLAPDWLESNVRVAGKVGGLLNPANWKKAEYAPYIRFAKNATAMYGTFAMTNKALSGHFPWENGAGQEFNLATGTYDDRGRERMVPAFGTAFDFIRIPYTIVSSLAQNDPQQALNVVKNRMSPPASAALALISNQDYRGREITSPDKSIMDNIAGIAGQAGQAVGVPSQVTNTIQAVRGESTPEELVAGLLEAPLRYRGGAKTPAQRKTAELLKEGGATNQDVNEALTYKPTKGEGIQSLFGGKKYSTLGAESDGKIQMPKTKKEKDAFDKSVDQALEGGSVDLPDSAIITRFFDGKTYDKSARSGQQDILNKMLKVADDEYLTPEQKAKIANAAKIDQADLQIYRTASLDEGDRLEGLLQYASQDQPNREEFIQNLILGKKSVGGKSMFSTSMYDRLYDEGLITKEEKALITATKYDPIYNKFYMDRDYKGSGGTSDAKRKASIKALNTLFKNPLKVNTKVKTPAELDKEATTPTAPKLNFKKAPKGKTSTSDWFTAY